MARARSSRAAICYRKESNDESENQWQQTSDPYPADPYSTAGTSGTAPSQGAASTKTDAAKEEASNIAGQAAGAAQNVAGTAKAEAANVASEVKTNAKDLLQQAKSDLTDQAGSQQQKAAEGIRTISSQLRSMADAPEQQGVASDLIRQAAERSESIASWLGNRDPGTLLNEVTSFARQRPGTFLLLAAGAGLLAGRLGRSPQAGAPETTTATGTTLPQQPVQAPVTGSAVSTGIEEPFYDEITTARPGAAATASSTVPGGPTSGAPLGDVEDPYAEGGGRPL
ncbi:hypothetical protein [Arthrobacter sp. ISL-65]|uniref:hypothetical protein n=1 Tax=Arthrobacter sp. ISL-65 TaxID=2819112 RepID=UPI002034FF9A|nr:hypothetical protein [Arthrobacter sp. ISL-65]